MKYIDLKLNEANKASERIELFNFYCNAIEILMNNSLPKALVFGKTTAKEIASDYLKTHNKTLNDMPSPISIDDLVRKNGEKIGLSAGIAFDDTDTKFNKALSHKTKWKFFLGLQNFIDAVDAVKSEQRPNPLSKSKGRTY